MSLRFDNEMEMPVSNGALTHPDTLLTWLCPGDFARGGLFRVYREDGAGAARSVYWATVLVQRAWCAAIS